MKSSKRKKKTIKGLIIFLFIDLLLFILSFNVAYSSCKEILNTERVKGKISLISFGSSPTGSGCSAYVEYNYLGHTYEEIYDNSVDCKETPGKSVAVYVDKDNPTTIIVKNSWLPFTALAIGSGLLFIMIIILTIMSVIKNKKEEK